MKLAARLLIIMMLVAGVAQAQPAGDAPVRQTFSVWTAVARNEPLKTRVGHTHDRDLYVLGLRARWSMQPGSGIQLAYTADLLP